jgi:hypothetical protein
VLENGLIFLTKAVLVSELIMSGSPRGANGYRECARFVEIDPSKIRGKSPIISPDLESEPITIFRLEIVRESGDTASKRHLIQAKSAP